MKKPYFASNETIEHYTPRYVWERAIICMGAIDCDPAADPGHAIPAAVHYTKKENGLIHPWDKRVWLNPPFGELVPKFFTKLEKEIEVGRVSECIILWKSATETAAWRKISSLTGYVAFPHHRIEFLGGTTKGGKGSNFSPSLFYIGPHPENFISAYIDMADIWKLIASSNQKKKRGNFNIYPEQKNNFPLQENHKLERWS